jgi:hypothetical protein
LNVLERNVSAGQLMKLAFRVSHNRKSRGVFVAVGAKIVAAGLTRPKIVIRSMTCQRLADLA